jgi:predicted cupin superfamily sugar epimerase
VLTADDVIRLLSLVPLEPEGGYFRETYRSSLTFCARSASTAIYYLLTPTTYSAIHRVASDEIFHHYLGDPVEMLQLLPDGSGKIVLIGPDLGRGMRPQVIVPGGTWQGCRLVTGGRCALMGTTVAPGFSYDDFELAGREVLLRDFPAHAAMIRNLAREQTP